jgi:hypothetical protein
MERWGRALRMGDRVWMTGEIDNWISVPIGWVGW